VYRRAHRRPRSQHSRPHPAEALEPRLLLATFTVTNTASTGAGSLRQAILDANAAAGADVIRFNLPTAPAAGYIIRSALPAVTGPTDVDGTTQPGYTFGKPVVVVQGGGPATTSDGLVFTDAGACRVRGLIVNNWGGSGIKSSGATQLVVEGNWVGLDPSGNLPVANKIGINILSSGARIGGTSEDQRNVISGHTITGAAATGIDLAGDDNVVVGNYIGTTWQGNNPLPNRLGVNVGGSRNRVGGTTAGERNVISGNTTGVSIGRYQPGGVPTSLDNVVQGNYIGTNYLANLGVPNTTRGVYVTAGSDRAVIGGTAPGARNIIAGNATGIEVGYVGGFADPPDVVPPVNTRVEGNFVGLNPSGLTIPNTTGVTMQNGVIGGTAAGARNVISGNTTGILFRNGAPQRVEGNYIGLNPAGTLARPNAVGILVDYGNVTRIGGSAPGAGNVISGNTEAGIRVARATAPGSQGHLIEGNLIGTNAAGTAAVGNGVGIDVTATGRAVIGGDSPGARNVISGNTGDGIRAGTGSTVQGNYIGTDAAGTGPLGNGGHGVAATVVRLSVLSNIIAYNGGDGIRLTGGDSNTFLSNSIYSNAGLGIDLGGDGVTPNDAGDADTGPNERQNFPALTSVLSDGASTFVRGTIEGRPAPNTFRIQFFASPVQDPSTFGEGAGYLGEVTLDVGTSGKGEFSATLPAVLAGYVITATATGRRANAPATSTDFQTSEFSKAVTVPRADTAPPAVVGVYVNGTAWSPTFRQHLANAAVGHQQIGYRVPGGPAQRAPLPWSNLNELSVTFSEEVSVQQDDLVIRGAGGVLPVASFTSGPGIGTWRLASPLRAERLTLELKSGGTTGVTDLVNHALDGEWADGADFMPSGDGAAGGNFVFRFNVLPGDATRNGSVNAADLAEVRRRFASAVVAGGAATSPRYSLFADFDGSGVINALDLLTARRNEHRILPQ
jgi:hypothetical protein